MGTVISPGQPKPADDKNPRPPPGSKPTPVPTPPKDPPKPK
jgi:hypothetical protein